jgi:aryl-alcohol dehydrogenase
VVLGHEGAGVVERVGAAVTKVKAGDHVVMTYPSCGKCPNCMADRPAYCLESYQRIFSGARIDGSTALHRRGQNEPVHGHFFAQSSFATYSLATERNVVNVRKDVPLEMLGPLGCGIQTGAGAVLNTMQAPAGSSIAIFGSGAVGLSALMAARVAGCTTIIAVDTKPNRLTLARELGATHTLNALETDVVEEVQHITGGGATFTLETTGRPQVLRQAVDALAILGTCVVVGAPPAGTEASFDVNNLFVFGRTIRGIVQGDSVPDVFIPRLIDLYVQGRFPFDRLLRFYPLEDINAAVQDAEQGTTIKPVLRMESVERKKK